MRSRRGRARRSGRGRGPRTGPIRHPFVLGRSVLGWPITGVELGEPDAKRRVAVICCIHGNENAGLAVVRQLERNPAGVDLWLVENGTPTASPQRTRATPTAST